MRKAANKCMQVHADRCDGGRVLVTATTQSQDAPLAALTFLVLISPVGKSHGISAMHIAQTLRNALGGHTMGEVGVATSIGVRAPDVAWCSDTYLADHPEEMPLSNAPELCVEIVSASNALPKLREKALAYVNAGAVEAWIVHPQSRQVEIYAREGRKTATSSAVDTTALLP